MPVYPLTIAGQIVRLLFGFQSDSSETFAGVYIDYILVK